MTQVILGWYSLQGCFLSWGSPCPMLAPGSRSAPSPHRGSQCLAPLIRACSNDSDPIAKDGAHDAQCHPPGTHATLQPSAGMLRLVPPHTTPWLGGCCVLVTLHKPCLKKNTTKTKNDSERFCMICYELVVGVFSKDTWLVYTADSLCGVENIGYRVIREIQWEVATKKRGFYPKWRAREILLPA